MPQDTAMRAPVVLEIGCNSFQTPSLTP